MKYKLVHDVSKAHTMDQTQMKNYYGTKIYPIVAQKHPKLAGKITGMFLGTGLNEFNETLNNESYLKTLCENPSFLEKQINEAIEVLESARGLESVRTSVRKKFSKLIFRRVNYIQSYNSKYFLIFPPLPNSLEGVSSINWVETDSDILKQPDLWKQYGDEKSDDFCGFTSHFSLRESDPYKNKQMPFSRQGYSVLDPITLELTPTKCSITPRTGDLICGIVETVNDEPFFDKWFVCSEQFYRCHTLCLFQHHDSFKHAQKKKSPEQYWMSGNRLMTNSYLKWLCALSEHGVLCTPEENDKKYWKLRTEPMSVTWIHIYCAMVYLVRYQEFPSSKNVPMNRGGLTYSKWHLPENWKNNFVNYHSS